MWFPTDSASGTRLLLDLQSEPERLPLLRPGIGAPGMPLLVEHARATYSRPGLRGHRPDGSAWSPLFRRGVVDDRDSAVSIEAIDAAAGLQLRTELESLVGGAIRGRHQLTNIGETPYHLEGIEVSFAVPDDHSELLDFTGRHERERVPQRRPISDGLWLRESRAGRPNHDAASLLIAGCPGFGFDRGAALGITVGFSGNSLLSCQRSGASGTVLSGGELLLPGELTLAAGADYTSPWVYLVAGDGLDALAHSLHTWQRSLPGHPGPQPVTLNVWEAVYFDHDLAKLTELADRAARIGVERYVLDDGWFHDRRTDLAGLGDWWIDDTVWPDGLGPLVHRVRELGMQFGLWFEPEMVNPDSDLFRAHPDWALQTGGRLPELSRNQLVLDLANPAAWTYVRDRMAEILDAYPIDFVKWDHNRELLDAGSTLRNGAAAVHDQTVAFYALLDDLRDRFPGIAWESCSGGGGRIDLGVLERVQRFWTSDMTDALSRQQIQRWTTQLVAPEYLGAHVSAPTSHQTGRTLPLDFRAATAFFYSFGIEWDITRADRDDLDRLAFWCSLYRSHRELLHRGRTVRIDTADPAVIGQAVLAPDQRSGLLLHVQLDESLHNRGAALRLPGLDPDRAYRIRRIDDEGTDLELTGRELTEGGLWLPRQQPETARLFSVTG